MLADVGVEGAAYGAPLVSDKKVSRPVVSHTERGDGGGWRCRSKATS